MDMNRNGWYIYRTTCRAGQMAYTSAYKAICMTLEILAVQMHKKIWIKNGSGTGNNRLNKARKCGRSNKFWAR